MENNQISRGRQLRRSSQQSSGGFQRNNVDFQPIIEPTISMSGTGGIGMSFKTNDPRVEMQKQQIQRMYEPTLEEKVAEKKALVRASKNEEMAVKKEALGKDLMKFLKVDMSIPRGKGAGRFAEGMKTKIESFLQNTPRGQAGDSFDALKKRLRVQLVRSAGDVGNINIVEQEAAEKIIPSEWDSQETADIKRAYLIDILDSINSDNPDRLLKALGRAGVNFENISEGMARLEVAPSVYDPEGLTRS